MREFSLPKDKFIELFALLCLFLYFLTVSAEMLYVDVYLFKPKINHIFAVMLLIFACGKRFFFDRKLVSSVLLILFSITLSALFSPCIGRSIGYVAASAFTLFFFFLLPIHFMIAYDHQRLLRLYFLSFLCMGSYAALQFLLSLIGIYDPFAIQRAAGTIARAQALTYEPSFYALYAIPFVMYYNAKQLFIVQRFFTWKNMACLFLVNFLLIASTSTAAFFGYIFFSVLILFFAARGNVLKILFSLVALFFLFAVSNLQLFLDTFFKFFHIGFFAHWSFMERWEAIVNAWDIFCKHPFFGVGLGGVGPSIYLEQNFPYTEAALVRPTLDMFSLIDPKNVFPELLASLGIFGLIIFCICGKRICAFFTQALKDECLDRIDRINILALFLSALVMLFCLQFNQGLFRSYVWLHLGISVGYVLKVYQRKDAKSQNRGKN